MPLVRFYTLNLFQKLVRNAQPSYQCIKLFSKKETIPVIATNQDLLLQNLKNAPSTNKLLEIISTHHQIMNNKHTIQAIKSLFYLQKGKRSSSSDVISHSSFQSLCLNLKKNIRIIEINDLIETLKTLSYIGVQCNSTIIQIILQMIRKEINNLNLHQIIFIDFLLHQLEPTPLRDALLIALPIVFEINLPMKIDAENLSQLAEILQYSVKYNLPESKINLIMENIASNNEINLKAIVSIVWSICDLRPNENFVPILDKYLGIMANHGNELHISDVETILTKLSYRYNQKYSYFYNKEYFDFVSQYIIDNNVDFQRTIWIFRKFSKMGYTNKNLLDYISMFCYNDKSLISEANIKNVSFLVTGLSESDYRPIHWESIKQGILENKNLLSDSSSIQWIKFTSKLILLDIFIPELLQKSLNESYIENLIENGSKENLKNFLMVYQIISTLKPEYSNILPHSSFIQKMKKLLYNSELININYSFQAALEKGFGGDAYVLSNITTKLGHLLDFVIIMRKGGYPIAINDKNISDLEELQIPTDSHVIVIFCCDSSYYNSDNKLKRTYSIMFQTVEACGYSVIPINLESWTNLLDHEKIPYLMQAVKLKNIEFEKESVSQR